MTDPKKLDFAIFDTGLVPSVKAQKQNIQITKALDKRDRKNQKRLKSWTGQR